MSPNSLEVIKKNFGSRALVVDEIHLEFLKGVAIGRSGWWLSVFQLQQDHTPKTPRYGLETPLAKCH